MDIVNLYSNIPHDLGLEAIHYWIMKLPPSHSRFPHDFILKCLDIVLKNNIFNFNNNFYKQVKGTAMGTKCAPYYATLTLAYLETNTIIPKIQNKFGMEVSNYFSNNFYRYLDDCFIIWPKSYPSFSEILSILNQAHPSIKFTSSISEKQIPFLDVLIILTEHNTIITDIYRKPTDSQNYLHFHSSHPSHTKRNIPYTLSRRICTIVSEPTTKNLRLHEMKSILISKKYPIKLIDNAIEKALNIPQNILRIPKQQRNQQEISLTLTFNPNNPIVTNSMNYFFQMLKTNNQTKDIFQNSTLRICKC